MPTLAEQKAANRRAIYIEALIKCRFNKCEAARKLGISERQIFRFCAAELSTHDRNVIEAKCAESGGIDPKSLAGAGLV